MNQNLKILFIGNFLSPESNPLPSWYLAKKFRNMGWEIEVVSTKKNKILRLFNMVSSLMKMRNQCQLLHIDVFSGLAFTWSFLIGTIAQLIKKPYILTLRGGNLPKFSKRSPFFVKYLFKHAKKIITPSRYLFEKMKIYGEDSRFILIPNSINISNYSYSPKVSLQNLIWLRSYRFIYNPSIAIEALEKLIHQFPKLKLTFIGSDSGDGTKHNLRNIVKEKEMSEYVFIADKVNKEEVPHVLSEADIFLNTTNIDNAPVSVIEAMACGLCIVSTNVGGIPYLLEHEKEALLVPPDDPGAMAKAIERILSDPELAMTLSRNAREKAENYDWSVTFPKWKELFEEAVDRK